MASQPAGNIHDVVKPSPGLSPEVLDIIFSFSSVGDAARCTRVCKAWTNVALDRVWRQLDFCDLVHLFSILAPLRAVLTAHGLLSRKMVRYY